LQLVYAVIRMRNLWLMRIHYSSNRLMG